MYVNSRSFHQICHHTVHPGDLRSRGLDDRQQGVRGVSRGDQLGALEGGCSFRTRIRRAGVIFILFCLESVLCHSRLDLLSE